MAKNVGELLVSIIGDISDVQKAFDDVTKQAGGLGKSLNSLGSNLQSVGTSMTTGITAPLVAAGVGIAAVASKAQSFEKDMAEVFTLLPGMSEEAMGSMKNDVLAFSKEMGTTTDEVIPALYQAISASVPADNVFEFLEVANEAAIGGVTDLETAVDGITSVVNAYGSDVISAAEASDLMFTGVKLGKTDFEQLSQSLYNVIPQASALGVEFGDVTAALAAITAQGTPTSVATTQLRQMFVELSKEGTQTSAVFREIAGKSFKQFVAEGNNTQDALKLLEDYARKTGVGINDLFGSVEAGNAALSLTGKGTETFTKDLEAMASAAGATGEAFNRVDATRGWDKLFATLDSLAIELGEKVLPILNDSLLPILTDTIVPFLENTLIPVIGTILDAFANLPKPVQLGIIAFGGLAAALGPLLIVAGSVVSAVGSIATVLGSAGLAGVLGTVGGALGSVVGVILGPVGIALAALAAAAYLIHTNWDTIAPIVEETMNTILTAISPTIDMVKEFVSDALEKLGAWWEENGDVIVSAVTKIGEAIGWLIESYIRYLADTVEAVLPPIISIVSYIAEQIGNMIVLVAQLISGDWNGAWQTAQDIVSTFTDFISNAIGTTFDGIKQYLEGFDLGPIATGIMDKLTSAIKSGALVPPIAIAQMMNSIIAKITGIDMFANGRTVITNFINGFKSQVNEFGSIGNVIDEYFTWYVGIAKRKLTEILTNASSILANLINVVTGAVNNILSPWISAWTSVQTAISSLWANIETEFSGWGAKLYEIGASWLQSIIDGFKSGFADLAGLAQDAWNTLTGSADENKTKDNAKTTSGGSSGSSSSGKKSSSSSSAVKIVSDTISKVTTTVKDAAKSAYDSGKKIVENISGGIKSSIGKVTTAISGTVSKISSYLPHSPAKVGPLSELPNWDAYFVDPITSSTAGMESVVSSNLSKVSDVVQSKIASLSKLSPSDFAIPMTTGWYDKERNEAVAEEAKAAFAKQSAAGNSTSPSATTYGGDSLVINGGVNLSQDYPIGDMMRDYQKEIARKRAQRGIRG